MVFVYDVRSSLSFIRLLMQSDLFVDTSHDELSPSAFVVHLGDGDSLEIVGDQESFMIDCQVGRHRGCGGDWNRRAAGCMSSWCTIVPLTPPVEGLRLLPTWNV